MALIRGILGCILTCMSVTSDLTSHAGGAARRLSQRAGAAAGALLATGAVAAVALPVGARVPRIGAPILALALGMAISAVTRAPQRLRGLGLISRQSLQAAIVLLGATISLSRVLAVGASSLPVMLGSLAASLFTATVIGRRLGVRRKLRVLIGVGTGICGASAIASVSGVIDADAREIRYAISTIFVFNLAAVLVFPALGHLLGMNAHQFGLWSGTAVNDTSSVLAAGFAYSHAAGPYALIVKLTRTTMIIPITLFLAGAAVRRGESRDGSEGGDGGRVTARPIARRARQVVPWFLVWFLAASAADTLGLIGPAARSASSDVGLALTALALAAVGLATDLRELRQTGLRPLALGALVWAAVASTSLALQVVTGTA